MWQGSQTRGIVARSCRAVNTLPLYQASKMSRLWLHVGVRKRRVTKKDRAELAQVPLDTKLLEESDSADRFVSRWLLRRPRTKYCAYEPLIQGDSNSPHFLYGS